MRDLLLRLTFAFLMGVQFGHCLQATWFLDPSMPWTLSTLTFCLGFAAGYTVRRSGDRD